jgi:hypothetical protein
MGLRVLTGIQKIVVAAAIGLAAIVSTVEAKKEVITSSSAGGSFATLAKWRETGAQASMGLAGDASQTLLGSQLPAGWLSGGPTTWEVGVALQSDVAGQITALRFYKVPGETTGHLGHVWSADGTQLAAVTFSNETASGWQEQVLPDPVPVAANVEFVVSVSTAPDDNIAVTHGTLGSSLVSGFLRSASLGGRFAAGGSYPDRSIEDNYFRDVVFVASTTSDGAPPTLTSLQPGNGSAVSGTATVSVTATDDVAVVGVQFLIDGVLIGSEDTTFPYSVVWDSASAVNGTHELTATARDAAGHQSLVTATITVMNTVSVGPVPPIPELANWQARMVNYGAQHCNPGSIAWAIGTQGVQTEDNVWYYDGTKVYQDIARYTQNPGWYTCAGYTNNAYRSWVLTLTNGLTSPTSALGGWRVFPDGLANDYWRTGDASSKDAAIRLALYSAFANSGGSPTCGLSRETAYILNAYLVAEELGEPRHPSYAAAVDNALIQLQKSFVTNECTFVVPFMIGLTMESLIHYYETTSDPRVPSAIETAADGLWARFWHAGTESFVYQSTNLNEGAPDLNMLIAPAYAWLWQLTGAQRHLDRGDVAFSSGVRRAWIGAGKAFSQNYRSSFNYVKWRSQPPGTIQPLTRY